MLQLKPQNSAHGVAGITLEHVIPKRDRYWFFYPGLLQLNFLLLGAIVADVTNGYDNSMLNGVQSLTQWQHYFHKPTGSKLGLIVNGQRIGAVGALFVTSPLINLLGRRWPILVGSLFMLLGIALQTATNGTTMFILGRVLIGFGNTIQVATSPILLSELAYPGQRAQITSILNTTGSLGQIMAAWITYGTGFMVGSWAWRLPSLLQGMTSIFQIVMVFFMPESPRWLVSKGREEEARRILIKYHAEGDENSELVKFEMAEISYTIEVDQAQSRSSWLEWIRTRANLHRLWIVTSLAFIIQWCGNAVLSYYLHLVLNSIGITSSKTQLIINGCMTINGFLWGIFFSLNVNRFGRRILFLGGMAGMFVAFLMLTIFTGINESHDFKYHGLGHGAIFCIFLFGVFYKMAGPVQDPYFMEVSPFHLRAKTSVIKAFGDTGANLFSGFVNPIALKAIEWKYYIVWCCVLVSNFIVIYFTYPETKGLSLEEVTQLFDGHEIPPDSVDSFEKTEKQVITRQEEVDGDSA